MTDDTFARSYTTSSLPLPLDGAQHARAFDFLVLLVNMTDSHSLEMARNALHHVRQETLFGHCAVLCTHGAPRRPPALISCHAHTAAFV